MRDVIDFYFDFSSPYGYLASKHVGGLATEFGVEVRWRPILLGAVFKVTGQSPLLGQSLRGPYHARDLARTARRLQIPFRLPEPFPFASIAAARAFYFLERRDRSTAIQVAHAIFDATFVDGLPPLKTEEVAEVAARCGVARDELSQGVAQQEIKDQLRQEVEVAIERGVFGSPFFFVGDEPFWGNDRMDDVREWIRTGGW